jgi:hypothetical protein
MIKSWRIKLAGHVAQMGRRSYLIEIGWGGMDWIDLAQGRDQWRALVNTVMNFTVS